MEWTNDIEEFGRRFWANPKAFARAHSEQMQGMPEAYADVVLNDPMHCINMLYELLDSLPQLIADAKKQRNERNLHNIKMALVGVLAPKIPIHPEFEIAIDECKHELNKHFFEVLTAEEKIVSNDLSTTTTPTIKPVTQAALALCYYYCHETKSLPPFQAGEMEQSYKDATKPYNLAWKPFQMAYNRFCRHRNERISKENMAGLRAAIEMLSNHPKALELAKDELNIAEIGNPIT